MRETILHYIIILRPKHWIKNGFVFAPVFFSGQLNQWGIFKEAFFAFIAFSLAASTVYILNDWFDREADAKHPEKKTRPFPKGVISSFEGFILGLSCIIVSISICGFFINSVTIWIICTYILLNIAYSIILKNVAIIDVCCIATGFVLRLFVGSVATRIELSSWIITMTFLLALFLALSKRRDDVIREELGNVRTRKAIYGYNIDFLNHTISIMGSVIIVAYLMYCHSDDRGFVLQNEYLYLTTAFVIVGLMRYFQLAIVDRCTGNPTKVLLNDKFTQINLIAWCGAFTWMIY